VIKTDQPAIQSSDILEEQSGSQNGQKVQKVNNRWLA